MADISVEPDPAFEDEAVRVCALGLRPAATVTLLASMPQAPSWRWVSRNTFRANSSGVVDLALDAPATGSYEGVDLLNPPDVRNITAALAAQGMLARPAEDLQLALNIVAGPDAGRGHCLAPHVAGTSARTAEGVSRSGPTNPQLAPGGP